MSGLDPKNQSIKVSFYQNESLIKRNFSHKIFLFADTDPTSKLCISIAESLSKLNPDVECVFVDVSQCYGNPNNSMDILKNGKYKIITLLCEKRENELLLRVFQSLLEQEKPSAVLVPHEFGYARIVTIVSRNMGIISIQFQHGEIHPEYFYYDEIVGMLDQCDKCIFQNNPSLKKDGLDYILKIQKNIIRNEIGLVQLIFKNVKNKNKKDNLNEFINVENRYLFETDIIAVNGEYYKQNLIEKGVSEDRIIVTGNIRLDQFYHEHIKQYNEICKDYDLDHRQPLVLYFYSPVEEAHLLYPLLYDPIEAIHDAINIVQAIKPDCNILILNHPRLPLNVLQSIKDLKKSNVKIGYINNNFWSLCNHAELIIGTQSTALIEALLVKKPIITQNYVFRNKGNSILSEYNAVIPIFHRIHLKRQIRKALTDPQCIKNLISNQEIAANELMGLFDGKCSERLAISILEIIKVI